MAVQLNGEPWKFLCSDGLLLLGMQAHGDAATVVLDLDAAVSQQADSDLLGETRQCLVRGVVDDFLNDVRGRVGVGLHARTLAHRLQPFEDPETRLVVVLLCHGLAFIVAVVGVTEVMVAKRAGRSPMRVMLSLIA